jgi:hypothetical protein
LPAKQGGPELGPLIGGENRTSASCPVAVDEDATGGIRDDRPLLACTRRLGDDCIEPCRRARVRSRRRDEVGDPGRENGGITQNGRLEIGVGAPLDVDGERDQEREHDRAEEIGRREDEPRAKAHGPSSSSEEKRKPTPRTVWM